MSLYFRLLDDLEKWLKEVETALASEDLGKDVTTVQVAYWHGAWWWSKTRG